MTDKALFIPLKTAYFNQFEDGSKTDELRAYGKRWNEKTCAVGRRAVISKGYGKQRRLHGVVSGFEVRPGTMFGEPDRTAIKECFGTLLIQIARITVKLDGVRA